MKHKKMTQKQFKEVLKKANIDIDIWGWDGILNLIAIAYRAMSKNDEEIDFPTIAQMDLETADTITRELDKTGFYD